MEEKKQSIKIVSSDDEVSLTTSSNKRKMNLPLDTKNSKKKKKQGQSTRFLLEQPSFIKGGTLHDF